VWTASPTVFRSPRILGTWSIWNSRTFGWLLVYAIDSLDVERLRIAGAGRNTEIRETIC
jgi:hypothetical protein